MVKEPLVFRVIDILLYEVYETRKARIVIYYVTTFVDPCMCIFAAPCENMSLGICGQRKPRLDCAFAQSDQGLHCPLTELLDTTEGMNGMQRPG